MYNNFVVADFMFKQPISYTYFVHKSNVYTWIDHVLTNTYNVGSVNQCHIVSEVMDNVSDHLPVGMELRVELCKVKTGKCPVTTGVIGSDVPWLECPACHALTWVITVTE